jgi:ABC-type transport system substrate-binding protein
MAELARFDGYWDRAHKAKLDVIRLLPIPEANSRLAALRSGQVDWIEVPPPDGIPSLKAAGFSVVKNSYPHVWPWMYNISARTSPFKDVRVRQALNYCIDRSGLVTLLNGTAEPAVGWLKATDEDFGSPVNRYGFDPAKGKAVELDPVDWTVVFNAVRLEPDNPGLHGAMALNFSAPSSDVSAMARYFLSEYCSPHGFNFEHWKDDQFEAALAKLAQSTDPAAIEAAYRAAHERLVDNPPWLFIVHDLNPRAMSKNVKGFVSAQSRFQDLTLVSMH